MTRLKSIQHTAKKVPKSYHTIDIGSKKSDKSRE